MNTIIEQIKAEIDKLYGEYKDKFHQYGDQYHLGLIDGLDMAEQVLDTLESEHLADARKTSPNDLEEAADNHIRNVVDIAGHPGWDWTTQDIADAFIAGAKWDREQMMKEVVEGWVAADSDTEGKRRVTLFPKKPVRDVLTEYKYWAATRPRYESIKLDSNAFPNLKWEDEPKKVRIIIVKED